MATQIDEKRALGRYDDFASAVMLTAIALFAISLGRTLIDLLLGYPIVRDWLAYRACNPRPRMDGVLSPSSRETGDAEIRSFDNTLVRT